MSKSHFSVAIIGAGPAGISAAATLNRYCIENIVIDDQVGPGGQVYRNILDNDNDKRNFLGEDYFKGYKLVNQIFNGKIKYQSKSTVWQITDGKEIALVTDGKSEIITADYIIIATGAMERPMPIEGWTLPGVMTVGGAQTLLKQSAIAAENAVFVGNGPLLYLTAWQYIQAGVGIIAVLDTTQAKNWRAAIPYAGRALLQPAMIKSGYDWLKEIKKNTNFISDVKNIEIIGNGKVTSVQYETGNGVTGKIETNNVFIHQGVIPNINLTMATGLSHGWNKSTFCWEPETDYSGKSSNDYIYIAGDAAGIDGSKAALIAGRIVAKEIINRFQPSRVSKLDLMIERLRYLHICSIRPFLNRLYRPSENFRTPKLDKTIVCRCEGVSKSDVIAALTHRIAGPNQLKAFCRAGMGRCQGRYCGLTVQELIATHNNENMEDTGYFRLRPPVKPITLAELASLKGSWPD